MSIHKTRVLFCCLAFLSIGQPVLADDNIVKNLLQPIPSSTTSALLPTQDYLLSGRWLYCVTQGSGSNARTDLIISAMNGTQSKVLHSFRGRILSLLPSYDTRYVTFTLANYNSYPVAYALNLDTTHIQLLTPYRANNLSGSISPDGKQYLFSSDMEGNIEIYLANLNASATGKTETPIRLTDEPNADISAFWTPNGQSFVFVSDRREFLHPQIYHYDLATGQARFIDTKSDYATEPRLNVTGDKMLFLNRTQGYIFDLTTGVKKPINNEGLDEAPIFSPDGNFVAYSTGKQLVVIPEPRIWEKSALSSNDKIVITPVLPKGVTGTIRRPIWLP